MKMKKTQSLKFMLLGLFAFASTGVWAQYTAVKGVVYGLNKAKDGAIVEGIIPAKLDVPFAVGQKTMEIQETVEIKGTTYNVVDFSADWKKARELKNDPVQGTAGSNTPPADPGLNDGSEWLPADPGQGATAPSAQTVYKTADATALDVTLDLVIRPATLTEITKEDVVDVPIAGFILAGTSGITEIPEVLFAAAQRVREINPDRQPAIDAANAQLNGTVGTGKPTDCLLKDYFVKKGLIDGKQAYKDEAGNYYVVDETITEQHVPEGPFLHPAYKFALQADNTFKQVEGIAYWVKIINDGLYSEGTAGFATKFTEDAEFTCVDGSKAKYEKAKAAWEQAVKDEDAAMKAWAAAVTAAAAGPGGQASEAVTAKGQAAERLKAAIEAIGNKGAQFARLQAQVREQLGTAVQDITPWFCGYALANNLIDTKGDDWNAETTELIAAYTAFYGTDEAAIPATPVTAYKFTSFGATKVTGAVDPSTGFLFTSEGITFTQYAMGLVADQTADTDAENADARAKKFSKVKVLTNNPDPADNSFKDKVFYVKIDPETKTIDPDTYYVLYQKNPNYPATSDEEFIPVADGAHAATPGKEFTATTASLEGVNGDGYGTLTLTLSATGESDRTSTIANVKYYDYNDGIHKIIVNSTEMYINGKYMTADGTSAWVAHEGKVYKLNTPSFTNEGGTWVAEATLVTEIVGATPATYDMVMCVKIGASQDYVLVPQPGIAPEMLAASPWRDINDAIDAYKPKTQDDLDDDVTKKKAAWDTAKQNTIDKKTDMDTKQGLMEADEQALADAEAIDEYINKYYYDVEGKNEVLLLGAFNNDVVSVGDRAFANCTKAKFTGTFRNNLKKIGKEAFINTLFANLDLSNTGKADWRGDADNDGKLDTDEDGNYIPDGKINILDRLTGSDIAQDAFVGTPMETMLLDATNVGDLWVYNVVRNIKFEEDVRYDIDCTPQYFTENNTLTTVTLPTGEAADENLEYDRVVEGTFRNCIELAKITIPAQVYQIEGDAFRRCLKLAEINFAPANSQLQRIGAYAFYQTAATWISLQAQTLLGQEFVTPNEFGKPEQAYWVNNWGNKVFMGDYAFAEMPNLQGVNITNTQLKTLPAHLFWNSKNLWGVAFFNADDPESKSAIETLPDGLFSTNKIKNLNLQYTRIRALENLFMAGPGDKEATDGCGNKYISNPINFTLESIILPDTLQTIDCFALASLQNEKFTEVEIPSTVTWIGDGAFYNSAKLKTVKCIDTQLKGFYAHTFGQTSLETLYFVSVNGATPCLFGQPTDEDIMWNTYWTVKDGMPCETDFHTEDGENYGFDDNLFFSCGSKLVNVYVTDGDIEILNAGANYTEGVGSHSRLLPYQLNIPLTMKAKINGTTYNWATFHSPYGAWFDSTEGVVIYTAYQMGNNIILYPAKIKGPGEDGWYKVAAFDPTIDWYLPVVDGHNWREAHVMGNDAAAVCIIRAEETVTSVSPKLYTDEIRKFQTTLDVENIMQVAREDIPGSTNTNNYQLQANGTKLRFKHMTQEGDVLLKGANYVKTEMDQGYGIRDFFDVIVVEPNDATGIMGVKEYMNSIDSDAIYNLNGVRVSTPQKGQMYIQNGKKFIQK